MRRRLCSGNRRRFFCCAVWGQPTLGAPARAPSGAAAAPASENRSASLRPACSSRSFPRPTCSPPPPWAACAAPGPSRSCGCGTAPTAGTWASRTRRGATPSPATTPPRTWRPAAHYVSARARHRRLHASTHQRQRRRCEPRLLPGQPASGRPAALRAGRGRGGRVALLRRGLVSALLFPGSLLRSRVRGLGRLPRARSGCPRLRGRSARIDLGLCPRLVRGRARRAAGTAHLAIAHTRLRRGCGRGGRFAGRPPPPGRRVGQAEARCRCVLCRQSRTNRPVWGGRRQAKVQRLHRLRSTLSHTRRGQLSPLQAAQGRAERRQPALQLLPPLPHAQQRRRRRRRRHAGELGPTTNALEPARAGRTRPAGLTRSLGVG